MKQEESRMDAVLEVFEWHAAEEDVAWALFRIEELPPPLEAIFPAKMKILLPGRTGCVTGRRCSPRGDRARQRCGLAVC